MCCSGGSGGGCWGGGGWGRCEGGGGCSFWGVDCPFAAQPCGSGEGLSSRLSRCDGCDFRVDALVRVFRGKLCTWSVHGRKGAFVRGTWGCCPSAHGHPAPWRPCQAGPGTHLRDTGMQGIRDGTSSLWDVSRFRFVRNSHATSRPQCESTRVEIQQNCLLYSCLCHTRSICRRGTVEICFRQQIGTACETNPKFSHTDKSRPAPPPSPCTRDVVHNTDI